MYNHKNEIVSQSALESDHSTPFEGGASVEGGCVFKDERKGGYDLLCEGGI